MTKETVIQRLEATLGMIKSLKEEEFDYGKFVRKGEMVNDTPCGTVCCVMGWYPKFFPESGLRWRFDLLRGGVGLTNMHNIYGYHGLSVDAIQFLFYGRALDPFVFEDRFFEGNLGKATKDEVEERFGAMIERLKNDEEFCNLHLRLNQQTEVDL